MFFPGKGRVVPTEFANHQRESTLRAIL